MEIKTEKGWRISLAKLKPIISEEELRYLYIVRKLSSTEIAKRYDTNKSAINKRLHLFNIPIRNNKEAQRIAQCKPETVKKKSERAKENLQKPNFYENYIINLRKVNVGRKPSPESLEKQRAKLIGRKRSPEHCANLSKSLKKWAKSNPEKMKAVHQAHLQMMSQTPKKFTDIEIQMAELLRGLNICFVTQQVIKKNFIVDFYLPEYALVIEADGDYWHGKPEQNKKDRSKDAYLKAIGLNVVRFWGSEIKKEPELVKSKIKEAISKCLKSII
jgi:very-short-patch-repair endonuclease